jgi:hypothetical protein
MTQHNTPPAAPPRAGLPVLLVVLFSTVGALTACAARREPLPSPARAAATTPPAPPVTTADETSPSPSPQPVIERRTVTETVEIPFTEQTVRDPALAKGATVVRSNGAAGLKTLTYEVTFTDGVETARNLVGEVVTRAPVHKVTAIGTKGQSRCDPNYSGACVPIASDVDCAGGSGNGPAYVRGPVKVIGTDIYDLDRDGDGTGCE